MSKKPTPKTNKRYTTEFKSEPLKLAERLSVKEPTNLSINSDLLKKARDLEINLSAALEQALTNQLKTKQAQQWREQNRSAIEAYNNSVDENGAFSDGLRGF